MKIDLFEVGMRADLGLTKRGDVLALVRAVRAARAVRHFETCAEYQYGSDIPSEASIDRMYAECDAALAPFTDSAEVRSDGE